MESSIQDKIIEINYWLKFLEGGLELKTGKNKQYLTFFGSIESCFRREERKINKTTKTNLTSQSATKIMHDLNAISNHVNFIRQIYQQITNVFKMIAFVKNNFSNKVLTDILEVITSIYPKKLRKKIFDYLKEKDYTEIPKAHVDLCMELAMANQNFILFKESFKGIIIIIKKAIEAIEKRQNIAIANIDQYIEEKKAADFINEKYAMINALKLEELIGLMVAADNYLDLIKPRFSQATLN
ncbi:MAG: hypothetical protein PHR00_00680 [Patescibacteria group bacterium]|nr:hypothetical protein [Patescibacteria group bacterium]